MSIFIEHENGETQFFHSIKEAKEDAIITTCINLTVEDFELIVIKNQYSVYNKDLELVSYSIPMVHKRNSMMWFGDIARTILANL